MYQLTNHELTVDILDPMADQARFGVRYCTGGYIYQVTDDQKGALLTGPTYPDSFNWFDGQGIPDAFNWSPLRQPQGSDSEVYIIGIGRCDLTTKQVLEFCQWDIEASPTAIQMKTHPTFAEFDFTLQRTVTLKERTVRSHTVITNHGNTFIPIAWFPHPFYPQPKTNELCRLSIPLSMPENEGYVMADNGFITRKAWPEQAGFYQALDHQAQNPVTITQRHPVLGMVSASCSYVPTFFPIWGNQNTFSWEPFFERIIAPSQSLSWWIDYDF
ncbi:hypothetical protein [Thiofilum flexile]|uniref:hypothetical protein n=1 Tax=Thiofilum flexile TaxID=125627 RepID=UPI0003764B96|nr:hypothetical protein [Thiofilum flexile]